MAVYNFLNMHRWVNLELSTNYTLLLLLLNCLHTKLFGIVFELYAWSI